MLDDELRIDAEEDAREADYILAQLPSDMKPHFTKDAILSLMDYIVEYYYENGVFDSDDDEIGIDLDEAAAYVCQQAAADGAGIYDPSEVFFVVQADLDYQEQMS
ncbi:MAG: hypothetical protein IJ637_09535 [Prevotella sp.]|nr:hypothetical protein [Prevotella sp.]